MADKKNKKKSGTNWLFVLSLIFLILSISALSVGVALMLQITVNLQFVSSMASLLLVIIGTIGSIIAGRGIKNSIKRGDK